MKKYKLIIVCTALTLFSCQTGMKVKYKSIIKPGTWLKNIKVNYSADGEDKYALLQVYFPKGYIFGKNLPTLVGLHGYKGSFDDWERMTSIESYADKYNFIIACPNMGTTIYEKKFYPETKSKWDGIPGGVWVAEILIPYLRDEFGIAEERDSTGIFGYSTGARGAVLIAASYPEIFGSAAGLSGDYDPLSMTGDSLLTSIYGSYSKFRERWEKDDNILKLAVNLVNTPLFIAHGEQDTVVPYEQSRLLTIRILQLRKKNNGEGYKIQYIKKKWLSHGWKFWSWTVPEMMDFFSLYIKRK